MLSNDKNIETLGLLVESIKDYIGLQKEHLKFDVTEKVVRMASLLTIGVIVITLSAVTLFYVSMAAIHWLSPIIGMAEAYMAASAVHLLLILIFYWLRKPLVINPLARLITKILICK